MWKPNKKRYKKLLVVFAGIIIIFIVTVKVIGSRAVKFGVEFSGQKALKVDVSVEGASLSLLSGRLELNNLEIGNPEGYTNKNLMQLNDINAKAWLGSLLGDTAVIEDLHFEGITLVLEQNGLSNNLQDILNMMPRGEEGSSESRESKGLNIRNLEITDTKVQVKLLPIPGRVKDLQLNLDTIVMKDLGSDSKMDMVELTSRILLAIASDIVKQGGDILPKEIIGPMTSLISESGKQLIEKGQEVLEEGKRASDKLLEKSKDLGKGVGEALEGLLKTEQKDNSGDN